MTLDITQVAELTERVLKEVERAIVGKREVLEQIMAAMLTAGGHVLLEDYPGLAKTLIANSFATALGLTFKRISSRRPVARRHHRRATSDRTQNSSPCARGRCSPTSSSRTRSTAPPPRRNRLLEACRSTR